MDRRLIACVLFFVLTFVHHKAAGGRPFLDWSKMSDTYCLALNIYHEARGEPIEGKIAVGHVTLTRYNKNLSSTVCDVVFAPSHLPETKPLSCQFSWTCDPSLDVSIKEKDREVFRKIRELAAAMIEGEYHYDITLGADHYYNCEQIELPESWYSLTKTVKIGKHCFYTSDDTFLRY